jgi:hypothetical protein
LARELFPDDDSEQDSIVLFKSLTRLHTIEMVVTHNQDLGHEPKSAEELDLWMDTAREALAGHEDRNGQSHGGKRIRMNYRFINHLNPAENQPAVHETLLDIEVD